MSVERARIGYVIGQLCQGGAERQLYELVRGLDRTRFQCVVYCLSDETAPYGDMITRAGADLRILKRRAHFDITRILALARLVRRDRIDLLHSFLYNANGYAWAARLLAGVPRLVTSSRSSHGVGTLRDWVNRLAFRMSDAIVCNGEAVRSFIVQHYGAPAARIAVIYNGVDLDRFAPEPAGARPLSESAERLVITVGRLVPAKDLDLFLEAAAVLVRERPEARFWIVGDGPCRGSLERSASKNGLDGRVSFLGERGDVPRLLQAADVFWLTSAWEGLPNALLEAMACEKPVVARDVGACREIICHEVNGYLVPGRDADQFARYTLDLLADAAQAREMSLAARRRAEEKFSLPAMVRATEQLYGSLLAGCARTTGQKITPRAAAL